jgi:outer membrane biosynthesis protein TonB
MAAAAEKKKKKKADQKMVLFAAGGVVLVVLLAVIFVVTLLLTDEGPKKKRDPQTVTLLKPPPPEEIKEKPPEEIKKEETVQTVTEMKQEGPQDNTPEGKELGVDADGAAGGDAFGLMGKKGGRALVSGDGAGAALLRKFGWYTNMIQDEIRKQVKNHLDKNGGIPKGKLQALVRVVIDDSGRIMDYQITGTSGHQKMDEAVKVTLGAIRLSQPPPEGMPRAMTVKISSQG